MRVFSVFALCALFLAGCANSLKPLPQTVEDGYRLGPGDEVRVHVFDETELSARYLISDAGTISMPLAGSIPASGLTARDLEQEITAHLGKRFVDPEVSVQVQKYRPFFILGEVEQPGQYPYVNDMTVLTAVAIGGGFTYRARTKTVNVTRFIDGTPVEGKADRTTQVRPGDVIYVTERIF